MRQMTVVSLALFVGSLFLAAVPRTQSRVDVTFSGGFDTDPRDHGRPVVLIAAALKLPGDVFREAFRYVNPAPAGREPDPEQVGRNKSALLQRLAPYGITNQRLDEVSDYYRYNGQRGELWRHTPANAYATVVNGTITAITVVEAGSGYSSPPRVAIPGFPGFHAVASLEFSADFKHNGSIQTIVASNP